MVQPPQLGSLVHSLAGRDAGDTYLVVGILDPNFVLVANGRSRTLRNPKKKNVRHLQVRGQSDPELILKLHRRQARDEEIAGAIRNMTALAQPGREREGIIPDVNEEEGRN